MRQEDRRVATREALLDAAETVFERRGFHAATLDDVATAAGRTKGAVYAHFGSKDALFLALLDRHLDAQLARATLFTDSADLRTGLQDASRAGLGASFGLLTLEFWLYAARHAEARAALTARVAALRGALADALAARGVAVGSTAPAGSAPGGTPPSASDAASLVLAIDAGLFLQQLVDPDAVPPTLRATALAAVVESGTPLAG